SWRKITSRFGPLRARHLAMRRSKVRRTPAAISGWANLLEDGHCADAGCGSQHRHDLAVPDPGERVGTAAAAWPLLLRRRPRIGLDPIAGRDAEPRLRGGDGG